MHDGSDLLGAIAGPQEVGWGTWDEGEFFCFNWSIVAL